MLVRFGFRKFARASGDE